MSERAEKTNVMRVLDQKKISYIAHTFDVSDGHLDGVTAAARIGKEPREVFKTLVTVSAGGGHYVFVIPVDRELDLKKAAKAVGEKSVAMIKQADLLSLTGYVHGGCSPVGMKKLFPTMFDESASDLTTITVSAGKVGRQVEVAPGDLIALVRGATAKLTAEEDADA